MNRATLLGHLGLDPHLNQTEHGSVCNLRLATTERWTDSQGQRQERTEWHDVAVWGRMAETCARYLRKGRQVLVEGRLQSREWRDDQDQLRRSWSIVARNIEFVGSSGSRDAGGNPERSAQAPSGWGAESSQSWGADENDPIPF